MYKMNKKVITAVCCAGVMAAAGVMSAMAQAPTVTVGQSAVEIGQSAGPAAGDQEVNVEDKIQIWGPVLSVDEDSIRIDNQSGVSFEGEMVLHISDETTKVLDAVGGLPISLEDIKEGEVIYAYIGQAMTMSLPPQTTAEMIIGNIPADYKVPEFVTVQSMTWNEDTSWTLVAANGTTYHIPGDTPIVPYLTRQMVTLESVTEGREVLIWSDAENNGQKLVLFNQEGMM